MRDFLLLHYQGGQWRVVFRRRLYGINGISNIWSKYNFEGTDTVLYTPVYKLLLSKYVLTGIII